MQPTTKRIGGRLLGLALAATLAAGARPASAWHYTLNGTCALESMGFATDLAQSVVVDAAGDIIAGGRIGATPYVNDGLVVKLSGRLGVPSVLWQTRFTSEYATPWNAVTRVALDGAGNVLVGGFVGGVDEAGDVPTQLMVAKLDGTTGAILWQQEIFPPSYPWDPTNMVTAVAVDSTGKVIAAGNADPDGDGVPNSAIVKFDGVTGAVLWQTTGPNGSRWSSVAIDHADNVLVGGFRGGDKAVAKYNGVTGVELWVTPEGGGSFTWFNSFRAVVVDASDNVVAAGSGFWVKKLDTDGTGLWEFNGAAGYGAYGLILDSAGNVFATGHVDSADDSAFGGNMATFKLDAATGTVLWQSILDGGAHGWDIGNTISLDPSGNLIVGGTLTTASRDTMAFLKFDATTGGEIWRVLVDGAGTDPSIHYGVGGDLGLQGAYAIAVDVWGDIIAGGSLNPASGDFRDVAVVKLNGADGSDFVQLCGNGVVEGTETCDDGNTTSGDGCSATCQTEPGFLCQGEPSACVATIGVVPKKLLVLDKLAASGTAKAVFAAKDKNVSKGTGTDPTAISASFTAAYANGAARGGFVVPAGAGWLVNTAKVAKYVNKAAPAGPTETKVALIRPGSALSLTAKGIGDTPFGILAAGDPAGDVNTAYCVSNGGPTICHCSVNQNCVFTKVAGDTGAKLVCKGGVADPTCAALVP